MRLHPATLILLDKEDIIDAIKQAIYEEYPEFRSTHNIIIDTKLEKVEVRTICYTPIKKANDSDEQK